MKNKLNIIKISAVLFIFLITVLSTFKIYSDNIDNKILKMNKKINTLKLKKDSLSIELDSLKNEINKYNRIHISKIAKVKIPKSFTNDKLKVLINTCEKYNVPVKLVCRLIYAESSFKESAISYAGARGYMQLMPNTIKHITQTTNLKYNDPYWNIKMGTYYISYLYNMFKRYNKLTRWRLTVLSYNIGPNRVKKDPKSHLFKYRNYPYLNKILGNKKLGNI